VVGSDWPQRVIAFFVMTVPLTLCALYRTREQTQGLLSNHYIDLMPADPHPVLSSAQSVECDMLNEFLRNMELERSAILDLMETRPSEDWTLELARIATLDISIGEQRARFGA
jgi:hypothetical protein